MDNTLSALQQIGRDLGVDVDVIEAAMMLVNLVRYSWWIWVENVS